MFDEQFKFESKEVVLHCDTHGDYNGSSTTVFGRLINSMCPACKTEQDLQEQIKKEREEAELKQKQIKHCIANVCLPLRFKNAAFSNYSTPTDGHKKAVQGCSEFANKMENREYANIILMGGVGTGKTHLAASICNRLAGQLISARYSSVREIVQSVRQTWGGGSSESEASVLSRYTNPDVLVIDEVGVQSGTANEQTILFDVINERYESMLPVVLVSNFDAAGIKQAIGDRSFDRVRDAGSCIPFTWGSFRVQRW
jgi:DNA replication protein DnaC